jgi:hypothetical protein
MSCDTGHPFTGNLLLAALAPRDVDLIAPHLARADHARGDTLFEADEDVSYVTFPLDRTVVTLVVPLVATGTSRRPRSVTRAPSAAASAKDTCRPSPDAWCWSKARSSAWRRTA